MALKIYVFTVNLTKTVTKIVKIKEKLEQRWIVNDESVIKISKLKIW